MEAYEEVCALAPILVQTESKFMDLGKLRHYWRWRREVFGEENYKKPLNLTGDGCMTEEDVVLLRTGSACVLPGNVLFIDRSVLTEEQLQNTFGRLRCVFYVISVAIGCCQPTCRESEEPATSLVALARIGEVSDNSFDTNFPNKMLDLVRNCLPVPFDAIHLVFQDQSTVATLALTFVTMLLRTYFGSRIYHHTIDSNDTTNMASSLKRVGLLKRQLPIALSGNWNSFDCWLRKRIKLEDGFFLSPEQRLERKRIANRLHSRQKRARRRIDYEVLEEQCVEQRQINERLKKENKQLETQLHAVQFLVDSGKSPNQSEATKQPSLHPTP